MEVKALAMQTCAVCSEQPPKYRCPTCRIRYCSLGCFKKHKNEDSCQPVKDTAPPAAAPPPAARHSNTQKPWTVEDLLDEDSQSDGLPLQKLQQLGKSKALMDLLHNPHLRQLMMDVDSAEDKAKVMKKAMQEPLFVEFADQCLRIVEPKEEEKEEDEGY